MWSLKRKLITLILKSFVRNQAICFYDLTWFSCVHAKDHVNSKHTSVSRHSYEALGDGKGKVTQGASGRALMGKESMLMALGYRKTVYKCWETQRKRDRALAQWVQEQVPKGWPLEQNEPEERRQGAAQLAREPSQSEVGCPAWRGLFGERICFQSKSAIYNRGTVICWLEPSKNPPQKHTAPEIFLGLASWYCPQNSVGGTVGKDPELPSYSSGPAVLSLRYLTSSRETKMDLAKASRVRSPQHRRPACSAVTFPKK